MNPATAIIAAHDGEKTCNTTWELLAFAEKLPDHAPEKCIVLFIGDHVTQIASKFSRQSGYASWALNVPGTDKYHPEIYLDLLSGKLASGVIRHILVMHNTTGMDFAPGLSHLLGGTCITAVESIRQNKETLSVTRSMFGGKIQADLEPGKMPLVLTIQPGACRAEKKDLDAVPKVIEENLDIFPSAVTHMERLPSPSQGSGLLKADVVISGGRGIEDEENYALIEQLAAEFPRSATGASRPICDYKWAPYGKQVGATGSIVSPKLYMACGISGATQHQEGMRDSRFIIAINSDPQAPIFQIADICIVEDLTSFIPILIEQIQKKKLPET